MEWIKCSDRMPAQQERVLGWCGYPIWASYKIAFGEVKWRATLWRYGLDFESHEVTHWMPLEAPNGKS